MDPQRPEFALINRSQRHMDAAIKEASTASTFDEAMDSLLVRTLAAKAGNAVLSTHLKLRDSLVKSVISG